MADLVSMMNIGKEMTRKLTAVGVDSPERLAQLGAEEAYFLLKARFPNVCLVHLYVLEGAIQGIPYNAIPQPRREELRQFSKRL